MSCDEIKESLALYFDDGLTGEARSACDRHLDVCPVCRVALSELRAITRGLGMLSTPAVPPNLVNSVNRALVAEGASRQRRTQESVGDFLMELLQPSLMRYAASSLASILLFAGVFLGFRPHMVALHEAAIAFDSAGAIIEEPGVFPVGYDITQPISSQSYSALRAPFNSESPSLNPSGALASLAWTPPPTHNRKRDDSDDMMVVADVFSNGVASLSDVMQAPHDPRILDEFQKALRQNAAFVPASLDRRPDTMRVVFSVQRVDVIDRNF